MIQYLKNLSVGLQASLNIWRAIQKFANCPHPRQDTTARKVGMN